MIFHLKNIYFFGRLIMETDEKVVIIIYIWKKKTWKDKNYEHKRNCDLEKIVLAICDGFSFHYIYVIVIYLFDLLLSNALLRLWAKRSWARRYRHRSLILMTIFTIFLLFSFFSLLVSAYVFLYFGKQCDPIIQLFSMATKRTTTSNHQIKIYVQMNAHNDARTRAFFSI